MVSGDEASQGARASYRPRHTLMVGSLRRHKRLITIAWQVLDHSRLQSLWPRSFLHRTGFVGGHFLERIRPWHDRVGILRH